MRSLGKLSTTLATNALNLQQPGGGATGVTDALAADAGLMPRSFIAVTAQT